MHLKYETCLELHWGSKVTHRAPQRSVSPLVLLSLESPSLCLSAPPPPSPSWNTGLRLIPNSEHCPAVIDVMMVHGCWYFRGVFIIWFDLFVRNHLKCLCVEPVSLNLQFCSIHLVSPMYVVNVNVNEHCWVLIQCISIFSLWQEIQATTSSKTDSNQFLKCSRWHDLFEKWNSD